MSNINPKTDQFSPLSLSVGDVLTNGDPIYQIPDYQRMYSWRDDEVSQLWDDIYEAYKNNEEDAEVDSNYFLGSLIVIQKEMNEDVVDGQQRLTTLMILLCVIKQTYPTINKKVDATQNPSVVKIRKIESCISTSNEINRLRLQSDPTQASNFEELIFSEDVDFTRYVKPSKKEIETDPKFRYINTAVILRDYILNMGEEECGKFISYLINKVKLIKITCYDESFAIKLFQVLNDRGMDLSPADIIKGYLLSALSGENNKHAHETFMADWRLCEEWVKDLDVDLTDMFTYYLYYLIARNPKKSLVDELKNEFKNQNSNTVMRDFKNFLDSYKTIFNSMDKVLTSCWHLPWATYWKTALITAEHCKYEDLARLQYSIMRFFYLYYMAGKTLNIIKQTCFHLILNIKKKAAIDKIERDLEKKLEDDGVINQVLENLQGEVYYENWLKPLMILIEYWQTDGNEVSYIDTDPKVISIEHIYPRNPAKGSEWEEMFPEGEEYTNTLGNLALLSGAKNRYAQNFTFAKKVNIYQGLDMSGKKSGDKNGKITVYQSTQKIINDYKGKVYHQKWNEKAVRDRYNWLCMEIDEILGIDVSGILY